MIEAKFEMTKEKRVNVNVTQKDEAKTKKKMEKVCESTSEIVLCK